MKKNEYENDGLFPKPARVPRRWVRYSGTVDLSARSFKLSERYFDSDFARLEAYIGRYYIRGKIIMQNGRDVLQVWVYPGVIAYIGFLCLLYVSFMVIEHPQVESYHRPGEQYVLFGFVAMWWLLILVGTFLRVRMVRDMMKRYFLEDWQFVIL